MANSYVDKAGDGSTKVFTFTFPYLAVAHLKVFVDGVSTTFTMPTSASIELATAPVSAAVIRIKRETPTSTSDETFVDFNDGSTLGEADLDKSALRVLYVAEEVVDAISDKLGLNDTGTVYAAGSKRISGVADPTSAQDAATKAYGDANWGGSSVTGAAAAQTAAEAAQTAAEAAVTEAETAQTAAEVAQTAAEAAAASLATPIPVASGGTGATDASTARTNLVVYSQAEVDALIAAIPSEDDVARNATILNALDIIEIEGASRKSLINMVVDALEDETGIDTGSSSNQTYDATNDFYSNVAGSQTQIAQGAGTVIGDMTSYGGNATAFNGTTTGNYSGNTIAGNGAATGFLGKDWGSGTKKQVTGFKAWSDDSRGFDIGNTGTTGNVTATLYGSDDGSSWTSLGSDTVADTASSQNTFTKLSGITTGYYRYHKLEFSAADGGGLGVAEVEFYESAVVDMTLLTNSMTADVAPSEARVVVDHQDLLGSVTLNTDFTAEVSRDGGTTWSAVTLTARRDAGGGRKVLMGDVIVSGQPSGTSLVIRLKTLNTLPQRVHKLAIQTDATLTV